MTAQNHEVQVVGDSLPAASGFRVSQVNLNDRSVEGLRHAREADRDRPVPPRGRARARSTRWRCSTGSWPRAGGARDASRRRARARAAKPASVLILGAARSSSARPPSSTTPAPRPAARCAPRASGRSSSTRNPATIMTDPEVADAVYLEPLTVEAVEAVIARERPEGLLAGLGGQTALNLAIAARRGRRPRAPRRPAARARRSRRSEMAEDREAFRDLLDRIGQPYAPIVDRRGRTRTSTTRAARDRPAGHRPAGVHARRHRRRHRRRPRRRTASASGPACAPAPSARSWSSAASSAGRRSSTRSCATPTTRASPCARWRTSTRSASTPATRSSSRPVQTLTDAVHQRLRSAALAIIRALGVEGGCNVQFALSPDSTEYAVIEVNPRVSRSSALASQGDRLPDRPGRGPDRGRAPAGRDPQRRHRHDGRRVRAGARLRRRQAAALPVRQVPDRRPDARQPDEGDRRGDGHRPDVRRGAQQGAPRPRAGRRRAARRGPVVDADVRLPRRRSTPATPRPTSRSAGSTRRGQACESTRFAQRTRRADRPAPLPRAVRLAAVAAARPAAPRRARRRSSARRPASRAWFLAEMGRNVALETRRGGRWASGSPTRATPTRPSCSRRPSAPASATRSWPGWPARPPRRCATRGWPSGIVPGYAMVDTCAAEFAAETPYFYSTYAAAGSAPEAPPVDRPAALVIGTGPVRIGQGIEFDYCAVQAADTLRRHGWQAVMINSNPETVSTDFDASSRLYFEPLDAESVRSVIDAETPPGERAPARRVVAFGGQTPLNLAAPLAAGGVPLLGSRPRGDRPGRGAGPLRGAARPARHPAARGRHGPQRRGGADARRADRLPGHRPAVVRDRRAGHRLLLLARGPRPPARARPTVVDPDRPVRIDRYLEGIEVDVDAVSDGERRAHPRAARARRAGRRPLRRQRRRLPAADASARATRT